jgi:hypothetical protein
MLYSEYHIVQTRVQPWQNWKKKCVMIIIDRYKGLSLMLPQPVRPNLLAWKIKARVHFEKILFDAKMPCSTVTLYIVPILVVQNTKSLGTHVINLQFNDFLSLTNVTIVHYFYLARSTVSIWSWCTTMKKVERENICHDYNIQIQKLISNVAWTCAAESFRVWKIKHTGLLWKVSIWRQNVRPLLSL